MNVAKQPPPIRAILVWFVPVFEPIIVLMAGLAVMFVDVLPQTLVLFALLHLVLPYLIRLYASGRATTISSANIPLLAFVVLLAVTCWVTPSWEITWRQVARMLWGVGVCLAVINWINPVTHNKTDTHEMRVFGFSLPLLWASVTFLLMGMFTTMVGMLGLQFSYKFTYLDEIQFLIPRLHMPGGGFHGFNTNHVGGIVAMYLPLVLALAIGPVMPKRPLYAIWPGWGVIKTLLVLVAFAMGLVLLLTQTRGAWLAVACALVVMLTFLGRRGWTLLAMLAVVTVVTVALIGPTRILDRLTIYDEEGRYENLLTPDRNVGARLILWERAMYALTDAPLTGVGLGGFEVISQVPDPRVTAFRPDPDMTHVHNIFLQMGVDFGLPGVVAFLAILGVTAHRLRAFVRGTTGLGLIHTWSIGLLGAFVAYLAYNLLNVIVMGSRPAVGVWFLFGLCIGAGEWMQGQANFGYSTSIMSASMRTSISTISTEKEDIGPPKLSKTKQDAVGQKRTSPKK